MASFSAADAAFTGFRLVREHPKTVLVWIGLYLAFSIAMVVAMTAAVGPALAELQAGAATGVVPDPSRSLALLGQLGPLYALALPISLAVYSMSFTAVNRLVLRPEEKGFFHIKLGVAEFNQFVIMVVSGAALLLTYVLGLLLMMVGVGVGAVAFGRMMQASTALGVIGGVLAVVLSIACLFAPMIFVGVRVSLASAMTYDTGALAFRRAWRLTRGHFWRIFGAYLILWVMLLIVLIVFTIVATAMAFGTMIGGAGGLDPSRIATLFGPPASMAALFGSPLLWLNYLVLSGFYVMGFLLLVGCSADIYRHLAATSPAKVAEAF